MTVAWLWAEWKPFVLGGLEKILLLLIKEVRMTVRMVRYGIGS